MKKLVLILLMLALLCAGCAKEPAVQTQPAETVPATTVPETTVPPETTEETIPVPELTYVIPKVDKLPAVLQLLSREDVVDVVGEYDESHYVIRLDAGYGIVEKAFARMTSEPAFEAFTAYARYKAPFYDNFRLSGEPVETLKTNTTLEILDDLGTCYLAMLDGKTGYIPKDMVSKNKITGGTGNGNSSADGGDISLSVPGIVPLFSFVPQEGNPAGEAMILADGTEVVLGWFEKTDSIPVVAEEGFAESLEGWHTVYLDGLYAYVRTELTYGEGDAIYEAWDAYAKYKAPIYDNFWLQGEAVQTLKTNTVIHITQELDGCYVVEVDGVSGYMPKDMVSKNKITGGTGNGNTSSEWTPPAM